MPEPVFNKSESVSACAIRWSNRAIDAEDRVDMLNATLKRVIAAGKALSDAAAPLNSKTADGVAAAAAVIKAACLQASDRGRQI